MDIELIWNAVYPNFTDNETRSAHLFADFICWCRVEQVTKRQARLLVVEAAGNAALFPPDDFFALAFVSIVGELTRNPNEDDERLDETFNEPVQQRAGIFISILKRFYSGQYSTQPRTAVAELLRDAFNQIADEETLLRIIESGDRRYSRIAGEVVMHGDEFYSIVELSELLSVSDLDDYLQEFGYSRESDVLILGDEVINWQRKRGGLLFRGPDDDEETEADQDW